MTLRISSFGVRGYVGGALTPKVVMDFASAFGTFAGGGRILLGRDTRYSSPMIHAAVVSSLLSAGCEILDFGICPAPILQYSVLPYKAAGAVSGDRPSRRSAPLFWPDASRARSNPGTAASNWPKESTPQC